MHSYSLRFSKAEENRHCYNSLAARPLWQLKLTYCVTLSCLTQWSPERQLLVFVLPPYLLGTPLLQKCRVPSRNCTYQSHAPLSKRGGGGGRLCTLKPSEQWENRGADFHNTVHCSGSELLILTQWEKLPAHSCRWARCAEWRSAFHWKRKGNRRNVNTWQDRMVGGYTGYPTCHLCADLKSDSSDN